MGNSMQQSTSSSSPDGPCDETKTTPEGAATPNKMNEETEGTSHMERRSKKSSMTWLRKFISLNKSPSTSRSTALSNNESPATQGKAQSVSLKSRLSNSKVCKRLRGTPSQGSPGTGATMGQGNKALITSLSESPEQDSALPLPQHRGQFSLPRIQIEAASDNPPSHSSVNSTSGLDNGQTT